MDNFQLPPPPVRHSKGKKYHRHRHHPYPSPPSPSAHRHHPALEHSPVGRLPHHDLPFRMGCPDHHHYKEGKLRMKPPKHLKVHKLQRKIVKAYKLPKGARHHHMRFPPPPPMEGIFSAPSCHQHSPGCCLHNREAMGGSSVAHEMSFCHHHHLRCHGRYPHPRPPSCPLNVAGCEIAPVSPQAMETSAEPPIEGGTRPPLISDMPPADEPAPVIQAP